MATGWTILPNLVSALRPQFSNFQDSDDIGNRRTTTLNRRAANYTPNLLNQYDQRGVPRALDVLGTAAAAATSSVNGAPARRQGERRV